MCHMLYVSEFIFLKKLLKKRFELLCFYQTALVQLNILHVFLYILQFLVLMNLCYA